MKNLLTVVLFTLGTVAALGAQKPPMALPRVAPAVDQILSLKRVGSPEISPDGRWVAVGGEFAAQSRIRPVIRPAEATDLQVAGTFQTSAGPPITATYIVRSADIRRSLGRDLSSGPTGTASVEIVPPGTLYGPRVYQVDGRVSKIIPVGRFRIQGNVDAFNIFNANPVLQHSNNYGTNGATWLRPEGQSGVMNARLFKVSGQVNF